MLHRIIFKLNDCRLKGFLLAETMAASVIAIFLMITILVLSGYLVANFHHGIDAYKLREQGYERLEDFIREKEV